MLTGSSVCGTICLFVFLAMMPQNPRFSQAILKCNGRSDRTLFRVFWSLHGTILWKAFRLVDILLVREFNKQFNKQSLDLFILIYQCVDWTELGCLFHFHNTNRSRGCNKVSPHVEEVAIRDFPLTTLSLFSHSPQTVSRFSGCFEFSFFSLGDAGLGLNLTFSFN